MIVKYISGGNYKWKLKQKRELSASHYESVLSDILSNELPLLPFLRQVEIKPYFNKTLYLDFYIPSFRTAIEVHGEQHYKFIRHFHKDKMGFIASAKNDRLKAIWCRINEIDLLELKYDQQHIWKSIITERFRQTK